MIYWFIAALVVTILSISINLIFKKNGQPDFLNKTYSKATIALILIILNFADWWTTKKILANDVGVEKGPIMEHIVLNSPHMAEPYKLGLGTIIAILVPFALHKDISIALGLVLFLIVCINTSILFI